MKKEKKIESKKKRKKEKEQLQAADQVLKSVGRADRGVYKGCARRTEEERKKGRTDEQTNRRTEEQTNRRTDEQKFQALPCTLHLHLQHKQYIHCSQAIAMLPQGRLTRTRLAFSRAVANTLGHASNAASASVRPRPLLMLSSQFKQCLSYSSSRKVCMPYHRTHAVQHGGQGLTDAEHLEVSTD